MRPLDSSVSQTGMSFDRRCKSTPEMLLASNLHGRVALPPFFPDTDKATDREGTVHSVTEAPENVEITVSTVGVMLTERELIFSGVGLAVLMFFLATVIAGGIIHSYGWRKGWAAAKRADKATDREDKVHSITEPPENVEITVSTVGVMLTERELIFSGAGLAVLVLFLATVVAGGIIHYYGWRKG
ncbi:hypothetical protein QQF64_012952 [Cirrhinus molitorella]|uniref:Uncharacterized protein n=1 Tax=Cirrhinus molitorella TaxID=172907 RepID=A0ABR3LSA6_9TELE